MPRMATGRVCLVVIATAMWLTFVSWPAYAACSPAGANNHSIGSVSHGWSRVFCQPANTYTYTVWTNHGHGQKYVSLWHSGTTHLHCDDIESGSVNANCSTSGLNTSHFSYHDIADPACNDRFNDGHGFACHEMEGLP